MVVVVVVQYGLKLYTDEEKREGGKQGGREREKVEGEEKRERMRRSGKYGWTALWLTLALHRPMTFLTPSSFLPSFPLPLLSHFVSFTPSLLVFHINGPVEQPLVQVESPSITVAKILSSWYVDPFHLRSYRRLTAIPGSDLSGNTFWEFKDALNANRMRRIVKTNPKTHLGDVQVTRTFICLYRASKQLMKMNQRNGINGFDTSVTIPPRSPSRNRILSDKNKSSISLD